MIEEFDKQRLASQAPGPARIGAAAAEPTSWEAEQERALEAQRARLEALRLEGDEFQVQVVRDGGACSEALVAVSPRGAVVFFEFKRSPVAVPPPPGVRFYALAVLAPAAQQAPVLETRWSTEPARRVHELRVVRREADGAGPARLDLLWKDGARHVLRARRDDADDEELEAVLGAQLRRFNAARVRVVRRLQQLWTLRTCPFVPAQHVGRLLALAALLLPDDDAAAAAAAAPPPATDSAAPAIVAASGHGPLWRRLGFTADPGAALRSLGLLGLHCLEEAARAPSAAAAVARGNWAASALSACASLMRLLALRDNLIRSAAADESWETPLFMFLCTCGAERPFEAVYALLLALHATRAPDAAAAALDDALRRAPETLDQLRAWLL